MNSARRRRTWHLQKRKEMTDTPKRTRITSFPHREMTPDDIRQLDERRKLDDDPDFIAGKTWAREQELNAPATVTRETHDEWLAVTNAITDEARRRHPDDVVAQNRFAEGARAWADA